MTVKARGPLVILCIGFYKSCSPTFVRKLYVQIVSPLSVLNYTCIALGQALKRTLPIRGSGICYWYRFDLKKNNEKLGQIGIVPERRIMKLKLFPFVY